VSALGLLVALAAARGDALTISMDPAASGIAVGDSVAIALNVSGLVDNAAPSLGNYEIDVAWDAGVVQLNGVSLGDQLALGVFGSTSTITIGAGTVNLLELSLESVADLNSLQAGSFTIATLTFQLIAVGSSAITPTVTVVRDATGSALAVDAISGAVVSAIPEPSTAVLCMVGLLRVRSRIRRAAPRMA
jgi:hypothetical protein